MRTTSALRNALLSSCGFACLLLVGIGCGDSAECVVDTDCELGNRCEAQVCVSLSTVPDRDTGPVPDADTEDASEPSDAGTDAGAPDAGDAAAGDAAAGDAGPDGGPDAGSLSACGAEGMYSVTPVGTNPGGCPVITECTVATTEGVTTANCGTVEADCSFDADCICTGPGMVGTIVATVTADFPGSTLAVAANGTTCDYTLSAI